MFDFLCLLFIIIFYNNKKNFLNIFYTINYTIWFIWLGISYLLLFILSLSLIIIFQRQTEIFLPFDFLVYYF